MQTGYLRCVHSLLLDLPKELRLMVYEALLVHHGDLWFHPSYLLYHCNHKLYPQILASCRFVYAEAIPLLYSENNLVIDSTGSMSKLWKIVKRPCPIFEKGKFWHITSLAIHSYNPLRTFLRDIETTAKGFPNLRCLSIELDDVIMGFYIRHRSKPKYDDRRKKLRESFLSSFHRITERHPVLKRINEIRHEDDVNYREGMRFRLLGDGVQVSTVILT